MQEKVSLKLRGQTLAEAFKLIEKECSARFTFNNNDLPDQKLRLTFRRKKLAFILDRLLADTPLRFSRKGQYIVILLDQNNVVPPLSSPPIPLPKKYTVSGFLQDTMTSEALIGGTIFVEELGKGVATNEYGFYSITLPEGKYHILYRYLGYKESRIFFELNKNIDRDVKLGLQEQDLPDIVVQSDESNEHIESIEGGSVVIEAPLAKAIPVFLGEPDIIRTIQLLPGVVSLGNGGFSVRGGKEDHNMILLDEAPLYNTTHLLGVFSVFNIDAINQARLIKGIPAEHRGRLSALLDVRMKEGTKGRKMAGKGGIGLLSSRLMLEGRLGEGKGSYMVAARRSYLDLLIAPFADDVLDTNFFSDYNLKANYQLNKRDRIFASAYFGKDRYGSKEEAAVEWSNRTTTLRWNRIFNDQLFMNTSLVLSDYDFETGSNFDGIVEINTGIEENLRVRTTVRDFSLNTKFQYYHDLDKSIKFGFSATHHFFRPAAVFERDKGIVDGREQRAVELGIYASEQWQVNDKLKLELGTHLSNMAILGQGKYEFQYDREGGKVDSTFFNSGQLVKNYFGVEPRIAAAYLINDQQSLKFSYTRTIQYLQRVNSAFANNPASIWLPSNKNIRPQQADQVTLGYYHNFFNHTVKASVEVYYKQMNRQIDYRDGALLGLTPRAIESLLVYGRSRAGGVEFSLSKSQGKVWGSISYTYSRIKNSFDQVNGGRSYSADNDIPHNLSVSAVWDISKKCSLAAGWGLRSGRLVTVPAGKYQINDQVIDYYRDRNNLRFPTHHRLDLSFTLRKKGKKKRQSYWNFALFNVYMRANPVFIYYDPKNVEDEGAVFQISLSSIIPSVTYNFEF